MLYEERLDIFLWYTLMTYLWGQNFAEDVLQALIFTIQPGRLQLLPTQNEIFVIDSQNITLKLTKHKQNKIFTFGEQIVKSEGHSVRKTANFLGNKVLCFEAVILEPLHYGNIETWKISAFKVEKGNSESKISISIIVKTGGMVERQLFTNYRNP